MGCKVSCTMKKFCSSKGNNEQMCPHRCNIHPLFSCCVPKVDFPWMIHPGFLVLWLLVGFGQWKSSSGDENYVSYCVLVALHFGSGRAPLLIARAPGRNPVSWLQTSGPSFCPFGSEMTMASCSQLVPWCFFGLEWSLNAPHTL